MSHPNGKNQVIYHISGNLLQAKRPWNLYVFLSFNEFVLKNQRQLDPEEAAPLASWRLSGHSVDIKQRMNAQQGGKIWTQESTEGLCEVKWKLAGFTEEIRAQSRTRTVCGGKASDLVRLRWAFWVLHQTNTMLISWFSATNSCSQTSLSPNHHSSTGRALWTLSN